MQQDQRTPLHILSYKEIPSLDSADLLIKCTSGSSLNIKDKV